LTFIGFVWSSAALAVLGWMAMTERSGEEQVAYDDLNASLRRDLAWLRRVFRF
jgi:hypothetical protein